MMAALESTPKPVRTQTPRSGETQMDILTDTRYLVPKIYSIVIGHAGIPPKKSVMAMLNSSFEKKLV